MFKRSANSARSSALRAGLFALAVVTPGVALAEPQGPLVMDATYSERVPVARVAGCAVTIAGLTDNRRAPQTIGIVAGFRSIEVTADREAWFRSIIETGLRVRGFTPTVALTPEPTPALAADVAPVDADTVATEAVAAEVVAPAPGPDVLTVRVRLQSVWLASLGMNKTGSVVLHMSAAHGAQSKDGYYRGEYVSPNWASGRGEFAEHLDRTFAEALNAMAADLAPLCNGVS
ncbi:MAG: hypothetical protein NT015_05385 [Alphaproteobacteria bacterium]|nr:hypothetical protein [Alphaproteobacteria bacterium]